MGKDSALSREALSRRMERLFFVNQSLLLSIGVGHSAIGAVHRVCEECGFGEGFKITGAGRGGCCIVSLLDREEREVQALRGRLVDGGYECYLVQTGQPGAVCDFHVE